jgi:hypothetical protein
MTERQLYFFGCLYLVMLIATAVFTRATVRRIAGALVGAAVGGPAVLGIVAAGEHAGLWHMAIIWEPYFLALFWVDLVLCAYVLLITWRIARRFGGRGLAVVAVGGANPRPAARLLVHEALPGMGELRAGACSYLRDLCVLFCPPARRARDHATGRRTGWQGPAGAAAVGDEDRT